MTSKTNCTTMVFKKCCITTRTKQWKSEPFLDRRRVRIFRFLRKAKWRLLPDGCVSKTLSKKTYHKSHNCKGAVRQKGHDYEVRCKNLFVQQCVKGMEMAALSKTSLTLSTWCPCFAVLYCTYIHFKPICIEYRKNMVKLFSCKAHDGDYFWLRYKHDAEELYHNLVIDGGRKSNASDFLFSSEMRTMALPWRLCVQNLIRRKTVSRRSQL